MGDRERASARVIVRSLAQAGILSVLGAGALFGKRQEDDSRVADALDAMRGRVDELARDLGQALERAEGESRRNRLLAELSSSIDLDELLERVLTAAAEVGGFEAGRIALEEPGTPPVVVARGPDGGRSSEPAHPGYRAGDRNDRRQLPVRGSRRLGRPSDVAGRRVRAAHRQGSHRSRDACSVLAAHDG